MTAGHADGWLSGAASFWGMPPTIRGSFTDADGTQPDFAAHWAVALEAEYGPLGEPL